MRDKACAGERTEPGAAKIRSAECRHGQCQVRWVTGPLTGCRRAARSLGPQPPPARIPWAKAVGNLDHRIDRCSVAAPGKRRGHIDQANPQPVVHPYAGTAWV